MDPDTKYRSSDATGSISPTKTNQIRISPAKTKDSRTTRLSLKPFSSSILQEKKKVLTKDEIEKMNSKIQLIKSKCMNIRPRIRKSESRKTSNSVCNELNDSVDEDS
jgi:hypothetical protein